MLVIDDDSVFQVNEGVAIRNVKNRVYFMLDSRTGSQYDLTEMEYEILDALSGHKSLREIVDTLIAEYDGDAQEIRDDLRRYTEQLLSGGLISIL